MNNFFNYFFEIYPLFYLFKKKTIYKTEDFQNWLTIDHSEKYITHVLLNKYIYVHTHLFIPRH